MTNISEFAAEKNLFVVFAHRQQRLLKGTVSRDSFCTDHHCSVGCTGNLVLLSLSTAGVVDIGGK
jgi:hypothetical protein